MIRRTLDRFGSCVFTAMFMGFLIPHAHADDIPRQLVEGLTSEDFKTRLRTQEDLLAWARKSPDASIDLLYDRYDAEKDPEARVRYLNVLRGLVADLYLKDGKGYVGIVMRPLLMNAAGGDPGIAQRLRVDSVVPDGPADHAGILPGDIILRINGRELQADDVMESFKGQVQKMKPGQKVELALSRNDEALNLTVTLGRLPPEAELRVFGQPQIPLEELDRNARERHFQEWLAAKKRERAS
jgi:S1-C subfamily serine protease